MEDFFRNIKINFEEFIEKLKFTDKKVIISTVSIIVAIIIACVSAYLIIEERKDPAYSADKTINGYIAAYQDFNYYEAYDYTILGKLGTDKYITDNYLSELKVGEIKSEEATGAINSLTLAYSVNVFDKASQIGFNDCDKLFKWYFDSTISSAKDTQIKDYVTQKVMLESFKSCLEAYKTITDQKLKDEYIGYDLKIEQVDMRDFTNDEVKLYITNKSDASKKTFQNAKLDANDINAVKSFKFNTKINSKPQSTMNVYLVKIGSKWYVDNTALI